jgi:hypothetical protein
MPVAFASGRIKSARGIASGLSVSVLCLFQRPTRLADGFGLKETLPYLPIGRIHPKGWFPRSPYGDSALVATYSSLSCATLISRRATSLFCPAVRAGAPLPSFVPWDNFRRVQPHLAPRDGHIMYALGENLSSRVRCQQMWDITGRGFPHVGPDGCGRCIAVPLLSRSW